MMREVVILLFLARVDDDMKIDRFEFCKIPEESNISV